MTEWYYVDQVKNDRVGPISQNELLALLQRGVLNDKSYVWKKGLDNWKFVSEVQELQGPGETRQVMPGLPPRRFIDELDWGRISPDARIFHVKIGMDRGWNDGPEYGPFTLSELRQMYQEKRIGPQTFYFAQGLRDWRYMAEIPIFDQLFGHGAPQIDRRDSIRRPFVARLFFHDNNTLFEGVCRDISIGGLQVLVSNYPGSLGDEVLLNIHPDNADEGIVAKGEIVRFLDADQGLSLRFTELDNQGRETIQKHVQS